MNQSTDISDFSNLFASLQGKIARSKAGAAAGTKTKGSFESLLKGIASGKNPGIRQGNSLTAKSTETDQAIDYSAKNILESLKKAILAGGVKNLETSGLDMEGLSKLENLLLKSGADPDRVSAIMSSLKARMTNGTVSLKEVFAGLNGMEKDDFFEDEFFLEVSASPYLESLLTSMGLDPGTVGNMLENATDPDKGLNIGKLVKALKNLDKSTFNGAAVFVRESDGLESASDILEKIGINIEENDKNGKMSLGRLMAILEKNSASEEAVKTGAIKDSFAKVLDSVKTGLSQPDPAGSSRAMLAKMQLAEDKKSDQAPEDRTKTKNEKQTLKTGHQDTVMTAKNELAAETARAEASTEQIFQARQKGPQDHGTEKTETALESSAKIYEMLMGREKTVSETVMAEQNQKPLPVYVANQAAKGIMKAVAGGEKEVVIQIKPPELGRMQIRIENTDAGIKVQIVTEKNSASELLNSNKQDLAAMLAESGVKVNKLDIQLSFNFDQAMSSMKDQAHQESGKRRNRKNDDGQAEDKASNKSGPVDEIETDDRLSLTA